MFEHKLGPFGCCLVVLLVATGCDDHKFASAHKEEESTIGQGYPAVQEIFQSNCYGCHSTGGTFPDLSVDICASLVGVTSQQTDLFLIAEGDAENSYLFNKLNATAGEVGGVDSVMPLSGPLGEAELTAIKNWINDGASCVDTVTEPEDTEASG